MPGHSVPSLLGLGLGRNEEIFRLCHASLMSTKMSRTYNARTEALLTISALMSTAVDILRFYYNIYDPS